MAGSQGFEPRTTSVSKTDDFTSLSKTQLAPTVRLELTSMASKATFLSIGEAGIGTPIRSRT